MATLPNKNGIAYSTPVGEQAGTLGAGGTALLKPKTTGNVPLAHNYCQIRISNTGGSNNLQLQRNGATDGEGVDVPADSNVVLEYTDADDDVWEVYSSAGTDYTAVFEEYKG